MSVRAGRGKTGAMPATVLTAEELERVERRLGDVGPWDDAARLSSGFVRMPDPAPRCALATERRTHSVPRRD